jgi:hypothetical protein
MVAEEIEKLLIRKVTGTIAGWPTISTMWLGRAWAASSLPVLRSGREFGKS